VSFTIKNLSPGIRVTAIGAVINILLSALKLVIGIVGNSRALVADAVHSLSDLATDIVLLFGLHYGSLPADKNHHYGHKKIETVTEVILGFNLILVAIKIAYDSGAAILLKKISQPTAITMVAALVSILSKEWLYRWTRAVAMRQDNRAILANAWEHRSDAFASVAVLIGLIFTQISAGLAIMDAVASLVVSLFILKIGWKIMLDGYKRIIDTAPPGGYVDRTERLIRDYPGVLNSHKLKMRYIGNSIHMEVHIEVDPNMTVEQGHEIAAGIKHKIRDDDNRVIDVIVHVEPRSC